MKNYITILIASCVLATNQYPTQEQINQMLHIAFEQIWVEAMKAKEAVNSPAFKNRTDDLLSNLASSAPTEYFVTHADLSATLQNAENTSASVFVSTDNQNSWIQNSNVAPINLPGYELTWGAITQTAGGNNIDWYLSGSIDSGSLGLDFGQMTVSQSPYNSSNQFPPSSNLYAMLASDPSGDAGSNQDIINLLGTYSDNKIFASLGLNAGCCDAGGFFGPWYLYVVAIVNPDAVSNVAYALGYGDGGFGQLFPALYKVNGDLTSGQVDGFSDLSSDFAYSTSGSSLQGTVSLDYLIQDSDWGAWPNSFNGVVLLGTTVEAGLDGLSVTTNVLDTTDPSVLVMSTQFQNENSPPDLSGANYNEESGELTIVYTDVDNNLATVHEVIVDDMVWTMIPDSHTYAEGVIFRAYGVTGGSTATFTFSDGAVISTESLEIGPSCLAGDSNGDGLVNVLDIVSTTNVILGVGNYNECLDMNSDGLINVLDIVAIVNVILGTV
tara:strand:- start:264 stop:1751 length:1488 start_codon:yes stop_codon:yes gene_type:complete